MCHVEVTIPNSRPDATRRRYCDPCKNHPKHYEYRAQIAKHGITIEQCDELYAITNCECCNRELTSGGGPGIAGHLKEILTTVMTQGKSVVSYAGNVTQALENLATTYLDSRTQSTI